MLNRQAGERPEHLRGTGRTQAGSRETRFYSPRAAGTVSIFNVDRVHRDDRFSPSETLLAHGRRPRFAPGGAACSSRYAPLAHRRAPFIALRRQFSFRTCATRRASRTAYPTCVENCLPDVRRELPFQDDCTVTNLMVVLRSAPPQNDDSAAAFFGPFLRVNFAMLCSSPR